MPGTSPDRRTARARLARCVAVVAVLVGLVLLPCADGMIMTGDHTAHGTTAAMAADRWDAMAMADEPGSGDMSGVLAACMLFLAVVVATVLGLRPGRPRGVAPILSRVGRAVRRAVGPPAPSLADLCLLRT